MPDDSLIPINRRIVAWDPDTGQPVVQNVPMFTRAQISEIALAAASQPYVDPDDEIKIELGLAPSRFFGRSNLEVMLVKQAEGAAKTGEGVDSILDRLIGKPKQSLESVKVSMSYEDWLKDVARREDSVEELA